MKSLLQKTLMQFFVRSVVLFLLMAPVFYLLTKSFYAEDMIDIIQAVERGDGIPKLDMEEDIMEGMMLQFLLIFMVISVSLFITVRFITQRLWQPFDDTLKKAERFELGQAEIPTFQATDIKEFARLNHTLTELMRKDQEAYRIQKEFTENASHELQTPLAVTRSKLDLLMQEDLDEQTMRIVSDLYDLNTRMGYLNRNLLLLAKIENAQYTGKKEVDLHAFIQRLLPGFLTLQDRYPLRFHDDRKHPSTLYCNAILLESLLNNLVVNAIRHTHKPDGEILLMLEDHKITISNTADDGALDSENLFRRFRSADVKDNGNGLGLSIVKAICDFHGWSVHYEYTAGAHHFIVSTNRESQV